MVMLSQGRGSWLCMLHPCVCSRPGLMEFEATWSVEGVPACVRGLEQDGLEDLSQAKTVLCLSDVCVS